MNLKTAFALFVTTMTIASEFDGATAASSASVLDEVDPPQTRNTKVEYGTKDGSTSPGVKEEEEFLSPFVMMTTAAAVAADGSNSTLATKQAIKEEKLVLDNEERVTATTTSTPEGFAASSLSSSSSLSLPSTLLEVSGADGDEVSAQRKLSKSSKKVKHPKALCTLSLFADSLFMYANRCFTDIMVTIASCDDKDDMCYISEHLPSLPQEELEEQENQEEEECFVGGLFPAKKNIRYNPSTGDCEFLYVDLTDDPCNLYTGDTGTGSLGLKARINVKNNPDVMLIQFSNDKGLTFYNHDDERVAKRSINRYLRQEGETRPVLSMMPHPFASRRLLYSRVSIKNDTPYEANFARIDYCSPICASDENNFIAPGGTWTVDVYRGGCLVQGIHATLRLKDGTRTKCAGYGSSGGTGIATFYIMFINGECCLRSWKQSNTECTKQVDDGDCNPSESNLLLPGGCDDNDCAHPDWLDGCEGCMCFNKGNAAWCDGLHGNYYDTYFEEHGENPWGDTNVKNRKCNTEFKAQGATCQDNWQCASEKCIRDALWYCTNII